MFFLLSKTLSYLTVPIVVISILLILGLALRNQTWRKKCLVAGVSLLLFMSNGFIVNEVARLWELPATPLDSIHKKYEFGIVLTGVTKLSQEPYDRVHFGRGADRFTHTVQLYKAGIIDKIIISGGSGHLFNVRRQEADDLASAFRMIGVPDSDILIENKSKNTYESAQEVKRLYGNLVSSDNALLITSAYHMRRSKACFAKAGFALDTFSTDFISQPRKFTPDALIIPHAEALIHWQTMIHEWMGMIAYKFAGYI
ncbi:MAG: YdcF family protein [Bacteroidetes bacterium]|nr:YdcF family protein [Bacteroidota bacterium]